MLYSMITSYWSTKSCLISAACHDEETSELRQSQLLPFNHLPYPKLERTTHTCTVADATYEGCACLGFAQIICVPMWICMQIWVHAIACLFHCGYVNIYGCVYAYAYMPMYEHVHMCGYMCMCIYFHVDYVYIHAWMCAFLCMHIYVWKCAYMDGLVCMYLHKCAQITFTCAERQQPIWTLYSWPVEATLLGLPAEPGSGFPVKHTKRASPIKSYTAT